MENITLDLLFEFVDVYAKIENKATGKEEKRDVKFEGENGLENF